METTIPKLYLGDIAIDDRGTVGFNNDLDLTGVKRFYTITNHVAGYTRAWHGHQNEGKYFIMLNGSAIIAAVKMKKPNVILPQAEDTVQTTRWELDYTKRFSQALTAKLPSVYYIPPEYANGFNLLSPDAKVMVLSTSTIEESRKDDYRFRYEEKFYNPFGVDLR